MIHRVLNGKTPEVKEGEHLEDAVLIGLETRFENYHFVAKHGNTSLTKNVVTVCPENIRFFGENIDQQLRDNEDRLIVSCLGEEFRDARNVVIELFKEHAESQAA